MKPKIVIIGSGLSALASLKYLIAEGLSEYVTLISETCINHNKLEKATKDQNYFRRAHPRLASLCDFSEVDADILTQSRICQSSIVELHTLGGLARYWGCGFFPPNSFYARPDDLDKFITTNFSITEAPVTADNLYSLPKNWRYLPPTFLSSSDSSVSYSNNFVPLNPGTEILKLHQTHGFYLKKDCLVTQIKPCCGDNDKHQIILENNSCLEATHIILACGTIGTAKLLINSRFPDLGSFNVFDHALYRIPIISLPNLFSLIIKVLKNISRKHYHSNSRPATSLYYPSLISSYSIENPKANSFLGIYTLHHLKFRFFPKLLNLLARYNVIMGIQLYIGGELGKVKHRVFLDKPKSGPNYSYKSLPFLYLPMIYLRLLLNLMLPMPFKVRAPFGSSYHLYGSVSNLLEAPSPSMKNNEFFDRIYFAGLSTVSSINETPPSYLLLRQAISTSAKVKSDIILSYLF